MLARLALLPALALLLVAASGCDSGGGTEQPPPSNAPTFEVISLARPFGDGTSGIQFAAKPNDNVSLIRVDVTNPAGATRTYRLQNSVVLGGELVDLQEEDFIFFRVSGTWKFRFVGSLAAGTKESFDVTTSISVGAFAPGAPTE